MSNDKSLPETAAGEVTPVPETKADRAAIEDWFFNHFHQQVVLNHPDVFERAVAAKEDLLSLLGLK